MGGDCSTPLPVLPSNNYMCVSTFYTDSLLLMYVGKTEIEAVRNAIMANWHKGIQREEYLCEENKSNPKNFNCLKVKLNGYPFSIGRGKDQAVQCRLMGGAIMTALYNLGWKLVVSSDLSRTCDLGAWFFQKQQLDHNAYPIFSIGLSSTDKLQINDCPESLHGVIRQICQGSWINGIQSEERMGRTYEIKLNGNPWSWTNRKESVSARVMLKDVIQKLTGRQYDLYCNTNLRGTADTLFFKYNQFLQGEANFLLVSLNRSDRLRLIRIPESICNQIKETVAQYWPYGIQDVKVDATCYELKLKGTPWNADGQEAVYSRRLITKIMERLASMGYFVMTGLDITRKVNDKSVFLFRQGAPLAAPFMCVSLNQTDKVRFIDAPQNAIQAGQGVLHQWPLGLQEETALYDGVTYQAKLRGNPWSAMSRGDGIYGRAMLLGLLSRFNSLGWRLVCSGDVSAKYVHQDDGPDYPIDVHSWWFMYDQVMLAHSNASLPQPVAQYQPVGQYGAMYPSNQFVNPAPGYVNPAPGYVNPVTPGYPSAGYPQLPDEPPPYNSIYMDNPAGYAGNPPH